MATKFFPMAMKVTKNCIMASFKAHVESRQTDGNFLQIMRGIFTFKLAWPCTVDATVVVVILRRRREQAVEPSFTL